MALFRPVINFARELWFALDTASAIRHGQPVSDQARRYCMADQSAPTVAREAQPSA